MAENWGNPIRSGSVRDMPKRPGGMSLSTEEETKRDNRKEKSPSTQIEERKY